MKKLLVPFLALLMVSCGIKEENEQLKQQLAEMETELEASRQAAETLQDVGEMIDSIEDRREILKLDLEKGTSYETYKDRLAKLNQYMEESERKLEEAEAMMAKANSQNSSFQNTIRRLKKQLKTRGEEVAQLSEQVEKFKSENTALIKTVDLQAKELQAQDDSIKQKREELMLLENQIEEMMVQAKKTTADAFYAQAEALEEAANRTKLAPKKKKATYAEALALYKKAFEAGKKDAYAKVEEMEEKVK
ncbi:hypothetical protein V6R21_30320 [Limibacter armeniacum]|uniref:hypothetical protein n=1 Tax=Limibacter armeniacum TaxID=466084 RepID=UPI002FE56C17